MIQDTPRDGVVKSSGFLVVPEFGVTVPVSRARADVPDGNVSTVEHVNLAEKKFHTDLGGGDFDIAEGGNVFVILEVEEGDHHSGICNCCVHETLYVGRSKCKVLKTMSCKHEDFRAMVKVIRLDSGRFNAEVLVNCANCGEAFRFIGLPAGVNLDGAAVSADGTEARLAIGPASSTKSFIDDCKGVTGIEVKVQRGNLPPNRN